MEDLTREYTLLFNGISDAIEDLAALSFRLKSLQAQAEDLFISRSAPDQSERPTAE